VIQQLLNVSETTPVTEMRARLGEVLGMKGPVPMPVLLRAINDPGFATDLITCRNAPNFLAALFDDRRTRAYEPVAEKTPMSSTKLASKGALGQGWILDRRRRDAGAPRGRLPHLPAFDRAGVDAAKDGARGQSVERGRQPTWAQDLRALWLRGDQENPPADRELPGRPSCTCRSDALAGAGGGAAGGRLNASRSLTDCG
jgi:hypothetical protein